MKGSFEALRDEWRKRFMRDRKLSAATKVVLSAIAMYLNRRSFKAWPSADTLATDTAMDRRNIFRAVKQAEARGHLKIDRGRRLKGKNNPSNIYTPLPQLAATGVVSIRHQGWCHPDTRTLDSEPLNKNILASLGAPSAPEIVPEGKEERKERKGWPKENGACSPTLPPNDSVPCDTGSKEGVRLRPPIIPSTDAPLAPTRVECSARPKLDWVPGVSTIDGTPRKAKAGVWGGCS